MARSGEVHNGRGQHGPAPELRGARPKHLGILGSLLRSGAARPRPRRHHRRDLPGGRLVGMLLSVIAMLLRPLLGVGSLQCPACQRACLSLWQAPLEARLLSPALLWPP